MGLYYYNKSESRADTPLKAAQSPANLSGFAKIRDDWGNQMKPPVIIPAYQPGPELEPLVKALLSDGQTDVIIVDDGSSPDRAAIFSALKALPRVHLLKHPVNLGKGQALKTAFAYFLNKFPAESPGVVTADSDGQHLPVDIAAISRCLAENSSALCLGTRKFKGSVPARSLFGKRGIPLAPLNALMGQISGSHRRADCNRILPWGC